MHDTRNRRLTFVHRLKYILNGFVGVTEAISGGARWELKLTVFKPNWERYGRAAGMIRNKEIIDAADEVVAFWDGQLDRTCEKDQQASGNHQFLKGQAMKNAVLIILSIILLAIGVGCTAVSKLVTPATIDKQAITYAANAGVIDANEFRGYPNLDKAERLAAAVISAYEVNSLELQQLAQKNQLNYDHLNGATTINLQVAQAREETLFGEKGLLSMGLTVLGFGGFTGLLGLMRKRPGDMTPVEVEQAVGSVTYDKDAKERQMGEVVRGVQSFIDDAKKMSFEELMAGFKDGNIGDVLKSYLASGQSPDTKLAVAEIKATA